MRKDAVNIFSTGCILAENLICAVCVDCEDAHFVPAGIDYTTNEVKHIAILCVCTDVLSVCNNVCEERYLIECLYAVKCSEVIKDFAESLCLIEFFALCIFIGSIANLCIVYEYGLAISTYFCFAVGTKLVVRSCVAYKKSLKLTVAVEEIPRCCALGFCNLESCLSGSNNCYAVVAKNCSCINYCCIESCVDCLKRHAIDSFHISFRCIKSCEDISCICEDVTCLVAGKLPCGCHILGRIELGLRVAVVLEVCKVLVSVKACVLKSESGSNVSLCPVVVTICKACVSSHVSPADIAVTIVLADPRISCIEEVVECSNCSALSGVCACCSNCYVERVVTCFRLLNLNDEALCCCGSRSCVNNVNNYVCSVTCESAVDVACEDVLNSLVVNETSECYCIEFVVCCACCALCKERSPCRGVNSSGYCVTFDCVLNSSCSNCSFNGNINSLDFCFCADVSHCNYIVLFAADCLVARCINSSHNACGDCAELDCLISLGIVFTSCYCSCYSVLACVERNACLICELSRRIENCCVVVTVCVDIVECYFVFTFCKVRDGSLELSSCHCCEAFNIVNNEFCLAECVEGVNNCVLNCAFGSTLEYYLVSGECDFVSILLNAVNFVCSSCEVLAELRSCIVTCCVCELRNITYSFDGTICVVSVSLALSCNEVCVSLYLCACVEERNGNESAVLSFSIKESVLLNVVTEVETVSCCKVTVLCETERLTNELLKLSSGNCVSFACAEDCELDCLCRINEDFFGVHCDISNSYEVGRSCCRLEVLAEVFALLCESVSFAVNLKEVKDCSEEVRSFTVGEFVVRVNAINVSHECSVERSAVFVCCVHPVVLPLVAVLRNVVFVAHESCDNNACFSKCDYRVGSVVSITVTGNERTLVAVADSSSVSFICVSLVLENNSVSEDAFVPPLCVNPTTVDLRNHKCEFGSCDLFFCRKSYVSDANALQFSNGLVVPLATCGRNACKCTDYHCKSEHKCKDS